MAENGEMLMIAKEKFMV